MPSRYDPADSLADIVENAERVERYLAGVDRGAFERSGMTRDAVERCLERVCEAIHRLGDQAEHLMPGHPWNDIRGMGNRLRHAYDRISLDVLWNAARHGVAPQNGQDSTVRGTDREHGRAVWLWSGCQPCPAAA